MKKQITASLTILMALSGLTACGNQQTLSPDFMAQPPQQILAQSNAGQKLSMQKEGAEEQKESSLKINEKATEGTRKQVKDLDIRIAGEETSNSRSRLDEYDLARIARSTLRSMESARTYREGYRIGYATLQSMARRGVYVGRVSEASADATRGYETGYKVIAAALNHISLGRANTPEEACNLVIKMMDAASTWSDGYRVGLAALKVIRRTDNYSVRIIIDSAIRSAESASSWETSYRIIHNALKELKYSF